MTTDFRALCAELFSCLEYLDRAYNIPLPPDLRDRARAALAEPVVEVSDDAGLDRWIVSQSSVPRSDEVFLDRNTYVYPMSMDDLRSLVRAAVTRYGTPRPVPVEVGEVSDEILQDAYWKAYHDHTMCGPPAQWVAGLRACAAVGRSHATPRLVPVEVEERLLLLKNGVQAGYERGHEDTVESCYGDPEEVAADLAAQLLEESIWAIPAPATTEEA